MGQDKIAKIRFEGGYAKIGALRILAACIVLAFIADDVESFAAKVCGSTSPCNCGSNCSGGNELYGQTQSYCDSNPIECFNTIDSCRDGNIVSLNYVKDINLSSLNNSVFRMGDTIEIDAILFSSSANSEGVFIVYANGTVNASVNWSVIYSTTFGAANSNYHIKYNYTIHRVLGEHTIRIIDEFSQVNNITCGRDSLADFPAYSDTDDITFTVLAQPSPSVNFTGPTPSNGTILTAVTLTVNVTHNETHPERLILNWNGTNESYSYSQGHSTIIKSNLQPGNYSFYVWVNDSFGNTNQTETRYVLINTPISITIGNPGANSQTRNSSLSLNVTALPSDGLNLSNVSFQLNTNANVSIFAKKLNISVDASDGDGLRNESAITHHNLSQSFIANQDMNINNISIKIKRSGFPNTTLQIRGDSGNNPSQTTLINISINNASVSASSFEWISFPVNGTISLENGTRYWLFLAGNGSVDDHYSWESNNDSLYSQGSFLGNSSVDLLFRIFDAYRFRAQITAPEGTNNLSVFARDSNDTTVSSSRIQFTVDTVAPAYSDDSVADDPIESGALQAFEVIVTDSTSQIDTVLLEFNNSNHTLQALGNTYNITVATGAIGTRSFRFYMNDSLGNMNVSASNSFVVQDSIGPAFSGLANAPNNDLALDPGVSVNVSVIISDSAGINVTFLQYKNSTSDWINLSMRNSSSLFWMNFTPSTQGVWQYRIWANDTSANSNTSSTVTLNISYDFNWSLAPLSFSAVSGIFGRNTTMGNLTINNSADHVLGFSLSSDRSFISFNSSSFTLAAGALGVIGVNATTPLEAATYSVINTIDAINASAIPDSQTNNATLVAIAQGPYLFIEIIQFNSSFLKPAFIDLRARITNIGNETAYNVSVNWSVPSDWTTIPSELNLTFRNITVNGVVYHNISADISEDASAGTKTISVNAQSQSGGNNSESETITVLSSGTSDSSQSSSGGGGGTSSGTTGSGGGFALPAKQQINVSILAPDMIEAFAPQNVTFTIQITNGMKNKVLTNVKIATDGFLKSKIDVSPSFIRFIDALETINATIALVIPEYLEQQNISLQLLVSGAAQGRFSNSTQELFEAKTEVSLLIQEMTKETAKSALEKAWDSLALMSRILETKRLEALLARAEEAFVKGNLVLAKQLADQIVSETELATQVFSSISSMKERLDSAAARGEEVAELQELLNLARELFNQENFAESQKILEQAVLAEKLHLERLESGFWSNMYSFFFAYWWAILIGIMAVGLGGAFIRKEFSLNALQEKVKDLDVKETTIFDLLKRTQQYYFKEKSMSARLYQKTMDQCTRQLAQVNEDRLTIKSRIIVRLKMARDWRALEMEKESIIDIIKDLQSKYFVKKIISKDTYESSVGEYQKRIAEIDKILRLIKDENKGSED